MSVRIPRVLIVEDDPDALLVLRVGLEAAGFETSLAADGGTALRRIEAERPDLVLLDLMLPVMDGWALLAELGRAPGGPSVVVLSAREARTDLSRAFEMGAAEYVTKPFDIDDLAETLRDVLERRRAVEPRPALGEIPGVEGIEPA